MITGVVYSKCPRCGEIYIYPFALHGSWIDKERDERDREDTSLCTVESKGPDDNDPIAVPC
jgi:uncharacterized OB-fold protein